MKTQSYGKDAITNPETLCDLRYRFNLTIRCAKARPMTSPPPFLHRKASLIYRGGDAIHGDDGAIWAIRCPLHQAAARMSGLRAILWAAALCAPVRIDGSNGKLVRIASLIRKPATSAQRCIMDVR